MFSRMLSIPLILAIIVCPVWCDSGLAECCAGETGNHPSDSPQICSPDDCCNAALPKQDKSSPSNAPSPPIESCQGVCGGAVLEKDDELSDGAIGFFLPQFNVTDVVVSRLAECRSRFVVPFSHSDGNIGRSFRTLHMSFLC